MEQLPLDDITILDLSQNVAGQFCTKSLSWLGARVVLVEKPGGADTRRMAPFYNDTPETEHSLLHLYLNTNKESITLDIHTKEGAEILKELACRCDILVEDYPPGELESLGLGYSDLEQINPRLITLSITNFGQTGPYRDWNATDLTILAMGGMSNMVGSKDREPLALAGHQGHYNGSVHAFAGVLTALWHRDLTDEGQHVDVSLVDAMAFSEWKGFTFYAADGKGRSRGTEASSSSYLLPCKDGYVGVMVNRPEYLQKLAELTGVEQLSDPKYNNTAALTEFAAEIKGILAEWVKDQGKEEIYHRSQRAGLPFCYFPTMAEMATSPQYESRKFLVEVDHQIVGKALYPGAPMKYRNMEFPNRPAPLLGEHNRSVYQNILGYDEKTIDNLTGTGII